MSNVPQQGRNTRSFLARGALLAAVLPAFAIVLSACSTATPATDSVVTTFIVVRHAEKATDDAKDPSLSDLGLQRAKRLAVRLDREPLVAAYATGFRRTRQTAQPTADAHRIAITAYDAPLPAAAFASQLRAAHERGSVLVVGHSNTVPDIVAALSGTPVEAMTEQQFDRLYRVSIGGDGNATLVEERY
ncbi:MAG: phosphoglycerate mutase family protein [Pseudoxanthomonas sp.]